MFIPETILTSEEEEIIFRIRQLIGDDKEVFVDDISITPNLPNVKVSGSLYELEEPKGYPQEVYVNGVQYGAVTSGATATSVLSYKFLKFQTTLGVGPLQNGSKLTVIYDNFRYSDYEIIQTYDTAATTYLVNQCGLDFPDLTVDLLILATAYVLLSGDVYKLTSNAIEIRDSDSEYKTAGATTGIRSLVDFMKIINDQLLDALNRKMSCKMMSLPIYKVE